MSALDAPMKTLAEGALAAGGRRFRFVPLRDRLRAASARPAALPAPAPAAAAAAADTSFTHLAEALAARRELDLTAAFSDYADAAAPLSLSLPLLLTARRRVVRLTLDALVPGTPAAHSLAECLCALARDLGPDTFLPFLPDVAAALAALFGGGTDSTGATGATGAERDAAAAQLWDPERTLVPAFAALGRIAKLLIQPLLRDPAAAVAALSPLLAHPHYRVREMAAEASAGYLLRKTRDAAALTALCDAVLRLPALAPAGARAAVDGTAAVLFEGTRAIRGGLHPFAEQIWAHVIQAVVGCDPADPRFLAVANALAAVRQAVSSEDAVACVSVCLLRCAERAAAEGARAGTGDPALANAMFLLRSWCGHRSGKRINEVHQQRALDVAVSVTAAGASSGDRATCEALGVVSAVLVALSSAAGAVRYRALNKSARSTLVAAAQGVPLRLTSVALQMLRVAYEARAVSAAEILPVYGALCDSGAGTEDDACVEHALLLLRQMSPQCADSAFVAQASLTKFDAPMLTKSVLQTLSSLQGRPATAVTDKTLLALEFCRLAVVADASNVLESIVDSVMAERSIGIVPSDEMGLGAQALDALVAQHLAKKREPGWEKVGCSLLKKASRLVLQTTEHIGVLRALTGLLRVTSSSFCIVDGDALIAAVAKCLSSCNRHVRCQAAYLLVQIASSEEGSARADGVEAAGTDDDEDDKERATASLIVGLEAGVNLRSVCDAVWRIFSAPLTVAESATTQQLVVALACIPRRQRERPNLRNLLTVLVHAAIGLFRTKFKLLWKPAGELWTAVATEDSKLAWAPLKDVLLSSRDDILRGCAQRVRSVDDEDDDEAAADCVEEGEDFFDGDANQSASAGYEKVGSSALDHGNVSSLVSDTKDSTSGGLKRKRHSSNVRNLGVDRAHSGEQQQLPPLKRVRRVQAKGVISIRWIPSSWEQQIKECQTETLSRVIVSIIKVDSSDDSTDSVTVHREVLVAIGKKPSVAYDQRAFIIRDLYLPLDSELMSRRLANNLVRVYSELLERLGGLKGSGNDLVLEQKMRSRLMQDLCRPESPCQSAVVKCLSASRSPDIKAYRDSLLRLIDDSTFRDELAVLSTRLRGEEDDMAGTAKSAAANGLQDVLVRICFGKMRGRRDKIGSRRGAVLAFIVATLSWSDAIPRLIELSIAPIEKEVAQLVRLMHDATSGRACVKEFGVSAPMNVLRGILRSMEAIIQQFGIAIPIASWRQLACAASVMLEATNMTGAKTIRALTLRRLASMVEKRPNESEFIVQRVVAVVRRGRFDASSAEDVMDAPGLLVFLAACARAPLPELHKSLVTQESWAFKWCLGVVKGSRGRFGAVELALDAARLVVDQIALAMAATGDSSVACNLSLDPELIAKVPFALEHRLDMFREFMAKEGKLGRWRLVLEKTMDIVAVLGNCGLADEQALRLVSSLSSFVVADVGRCQDATKGTLVALGGLFRHLCDHDEASTSRFSTVLPETFVSSNAMALGRLFNDNFVAGKSEEREALCKTVHSLQRRDLQVVAGHLSDLGAMRRDRVHEADYDKRLSTLSYVCKCVKKALEEGSDICLALHVETSLESENELEDASVAMNADALCAIMRGCLWALKDDDSATRGTAGFALTLLSQWASSIVEDACAQSTRVLFGNELLGALTCTTVQAPTIHERREVCTALGVFARESSEAVDWGPASLLRGLKALSCKDNPDLDFFANIAHLQPHRRSKALRQLSATLGCPSSDAVREKVSSISLSPADLTELATNFAMPVSYRIALDVSEATEKKTKHAKSMESRDAARADVVVWASSACGAACNHLPYADYRVLLSRVLRRLPREENESRLQSLYILLVDIAEAFPSLGDGNESNTEAGSFLSITILPQMLKHVTAGAVEGDILTSVLAGHTKRGQGGIGSGNAAARTGMVFRAPVAVAAAKLMTRMPLKEMESVLPLLITPVASALRSRMNDVRESAKKALVRLVVMLGSKYVPYVVRQVLQVLETGYRKDAGVYVLHALLLGVRTARSQLASGSIASSQCNDSCSEPYLPVDSAAGIIADALAAELVDGMSANAKDFDNPNVSSSRARDSASRATRAADAVEVLGELVIFNASAARIVKPFQEAVISTPSSKLASRIETALHRLCVGLVRNKSLSPDDALRFAYETVHDNMPPPGLVDNVAEEPVIVDDACRSFSKSPRAHVMAEFGLALLNSLLAKSIVKADGLDADCVRMRTMLEPFLAELGFALKSRFDSLTLLALKVTQRLVRLPLTGRKAVADGMTRTVLTVLSRRAVGRDSGPACSTNGQDLFQTSLRVASVIVQELGKGGGEGGSDHIGEESVRQLLVISRECLDSGSFEMRNAALAFVRSVVTARFKTPEIYDAVDDVSKLAVRGQSSHLQASCIAISVSFLVNYPLSAKRIRQQLEFYVRNLNYKHADGRLAALRALRTVIEKFPVANVNSESEFIFLPLAAVLANDGELSCREEASEVIKALLSRVSDARKIAEFLGMAKTLLGVSASNGTANPEITNSNDVSLRKAGAAVLGIAVLSNVLSKSQIRSVLATSVSVALEGCRDGSDQAWEITHAALCTVEKSMEALAETESGSSIKAETSLDLEHLWRSMAAMLQHHHGWVRLLACRLMGRHFAALGENYVTNEKRKEWYSLFDGPVGTIRDVMKALCLVLESVALSEALAEQALKNLLYIGNCIRQHPALGEVGLSLTLEDRVACEGSGCEGDGGEDPVSASNRGLYWLLRRMSGMATRSGRTDSSLLRRACAMRFLAAAVASWGVPAVTPYLRLFAGPVCRVVEHKGPLINGMSSVSPEAKASATATVSMAEAMQEMFIKELGADSYYVVYNELKAQRRAEQNERKRKYAVEAAVDPERAAKKRIKRSAAKSKARRRKASEGQGKGHAWRVAHSSHGVDGRDSNPLRDD